MADVKEAVRYLSSRCDGAHDQDGQGFNGHDAKFGNTMAGLPDELWTKELTVEAYLMVQKYGRQLSEGGITVYDIPEPEGFEPGCKTTRDVRVLDYREGVGLFIRTPYGDSSEPGSLGAHFDYEGKVWRVPASRAKLALEKARVWGLGISTAAREFCEGVTEEDEAFGMLFLSGDRLRFETPFSKELVDDIHKLSTARWMKPAWLVELWEVGPARAIARKHGVAIKPEVEALESLDPTDVLPETSARVGVAGGQFLIQFEYDPGLVKSVKELPGAKYHPATREWRVPATSVDEVTDWIRAHDVRVDVGAQDWLDDAARTQARVLRSMAATPLDPDFDVPGLNGTMYDFQRAGVEYALECLQSVPGVVFGDEPGLGKTIQAIALLEAKEAFPAVVCCPASLTLMWVRKIREWLPHRTAQIARSLTPGFEAELIADVTVIGWPVAYAWAEAFRPPAGLVLDESHWIADGKTLRTKGAIRLSDRMANSGVRVLLTGTMINTKPREAVAQLRAAQVLEKFGGTREFGKRYKARDIDSLVQLNRELRATCYIRREKADVLKDLPPKEWAEIPLEVDEKALAEYRKAEADIVKFLAEAAREAMLESGATDDEAREAAWIKALKTRQAQYLVEVGTLRRLAGIAKIGAVDGWISDFLESGKKLLIFGHHKEVTSHFAEAFCAGNAIVGGQDIELERQPIIDRFQEDPELKALSCAITAAGVGLTLTAASDCAFIEQGWTPGQMDQCIDRTHRDGQTDSVTGWVFVIPGTIDERMSRLIAEKRVVTHAVNVGEGLDLDLGGADGDDVRLALLIELTREGLEKG